MVTGGTVEALGSESCSAIFGQPLVGLVSEAPAMALYGAKLFGPKFSWKTFSVGTARLARCCSEAEMKEAGPQM